MMEKQENATLLSSEHITSLAFKGMDIVSDFMILKNDFVHSFDHATVRRRAPPTSYDKNTNTHEITKTNTITNLNMIIHSLDRATVRRAPPTSYSVSNHLRDLAQVELI